MPHALISRSPDLARLAADGYEIDVVGSYVVVGNVPYVDAARQIRRGRLVSALTLAGDTTARPGDHTTLFAGDMPCDASGNALLHIVASSGRQDLGDGLLVDHYFSSKPAAGFYTDYHEKMATYLAIITGPAEAIDPDATARTFRVIENADPSSPFVYLDTATGRARIGAISRKLEVGRIAIIGLGGTGSYILDLVAKTPVREIHLFDGDVFLSHNAFRSPGAASVAELREQSSKVERLARIYGEMHRGVVPHAVRIDATNVHLLAGMDFVFLSLDAGEAKAAIIGALEAAGTPFIDVGMGLEVVDDELIGTLRVTTSTPTMRDHVRTSDRIPMTGNGLDDVYSRNIQVADLNALNATMAVIRWKKLMGFYKDLEGEHFSAYVLDGNHLLNEDRG